MYRFDNRRKFLVQIFNMQQIISQKILLTTILITSKNEKVNNARNRRIHGLQGEAE